MKKEALYLLALVSTASAAGEQLLHSKAYSISGLAYSLAIKQWDTDKLVFEYEVTNTSKDAWALFDQGHHGKRFNKIAYCEALNDRDVEYSLKAFQEPKDRSCPLRVIPILPKVSLLRAGETARGQVMAMLPPQLHTPYDDCAPLPAFPKKSDKARFCLGAAKLSDIEANKVASGTVPVSTLENQKLLCSEMFDLTDNPAGN